MVRIALIGDRSDEVIAHRAIPKALELAADKHNIECKVEWIHSTEIELAELANYQGLWCVPNSPYQNPEQVIASIRYARESGIAFIGTCGGYQLSLIHI